MGGKLSILVLNLNKYEKVGEGKSIKCANVKKTFTINKKIIELKEKLYQFSLEINKITLEISKISEENINKKSLLYDKKNLINTEYVKTLNLLLELIIDDEEYIKGLISYLENVKIKCPSKYDEYEELLFDVYYGTDSSFFKKQPKKKPNKKVQSPLNINFHKLSDIIIKKLNISEIKKDDAMKKYKKKLFELSQLFIKNLQKTITKESTPKKSTVKKTSSKKTTLKKSTVKKTIPKKSTVKKTTK